MEITLSKKTLTNAVSVLLVVLAALGVYRVWSQDVLQEWFPRAEAVQAVEAEPALTSLEAMYSPSGERSEWEARVCAGMSEKGCVVFKGMYAEAIWKSPQNGKTASVVFIEVAETFEDGSQVWKTELTLDGTALPVYIHVAQNEEGKWLLNRVLFEQEAKKYEH
ncbi:MAG TPA: hypothetical protein VNK49_08875 [Anaerolineales bacterium]|nr:hypothetical protein [Anaerolineales bacterium]